MVIERAGLLIHLGGMHGRVYTSPGNLPVVYAHQALQILCGCRHIGMLDVEGESNLHNSKAYSFLHYGWPCEYNIATPCVQHPC